MQQILGNQNNLTINGLLEQTIYGQTKRTENCWPAARTIDLMRRIHDTYEGIMNGQKMDIHTNCETPVYLMRQCSKEEAALTTSTETDTSLGVELLSALSSMWMTSSCMLRVNKTSTS